MRELLLLRHAKSSWDDPKLSDHERPLNKRGTKAAARMGRYIAENDLQPDLILCSDAVRARATLALALRELGKSTPQTIITEKLYLAEPGEIVQVIKAHAGEAHRVLVVGHNPGFHALALTLTKASIEKDLQQLAQKFPTAALAHFVFDEADWPESTAASGTLQRFVVPRALTE